MGKQTNFGDALYNGQPIKGLDVMMGRTKSGVEFAIPIYDKPQHQNSLFEEGHFLGGLNVHVSDGRVAGLQAIFNPGDANSDVLDDTKQVRSFWRGAGIRGPASVSSGGRKVYGLVVYSDHSRIVGIQLILKR